MTIELDNDALEDSKIIAMKWLDPRDGGRALEIAQEIIKAYLQAVKPDVEKVAITRFELINHSGVGEQGREMVSYNAHSYSIQDGGKTLKVFKEPIQGKN